ncbi:MAG: GNAT family N-acetyltransferase [Clostridia bacterium]
MKFGKLKNLNIFQGDAMNKKLISVLKFYKNEAGEKVSIVFTKDFSGEDIFIIHLHRDNTILIIDKDTEELSNYTTLDFTSLHYYIRKEGNYVGGHTRILVEGCYKKEFCYISSIEVMPDKRKRGRGSLLLIFLETYIKRNKLQLGIEYIALMPASITKEVSLKAVENFYIKSGYKLNQDGFFYKKVKD